MDTSKCNTRQVITLFRDAARSQRRRGGGISWHRGAGEFCSASSRWQNASGCRQTMSTCQVNGGGGSVRLGRSRANPRGAETPRAYNVCVVETALGQEQKTCVSSRLLPPSSCVAPSKSLSASGGPHLRRLGGKLYGHHDCSSLTSGPSATQACLKIPPFPRTPEMSNRSRFS